MWSGKRNNFQDYIKQTARLEERSPENNCPNLFKFIYWLLEMKRTRISPQAHAAAAADGNGRGITSRLLPDPLSTQQIGPRQISGL